MTELADEQAEFNSARRNGLSVETEIPLSNGEQELLARGFEHFTFGGDQVVDMRLLDDGRSLWLKFG